MTEPRPRTQMPEDYAAKLEAARASRHMQGERRVVTILFSDVKGSTAMAEGLDPEDWAEIMDAAFDHLIEPIYRYEGTVARLMGDAILAFFGAPIAHEDDPERAVLAGLAILEELEPFCRWVREQYDLDFNVRVGINTGSVVVGEIGSDLMMEYTAMGDAVNLAARMESTAEPGSVQISEDTYRRVAPLFEVTTLEGIEVKGKGEPVSAYRVLGPKAVPGRLRGIEGLNSPVVGRRTELKQLQGAFEMLRQGRGGVAVLLGEAGLGKSRLIEEVKTDWLQEHDEHTWRESRGISYDSQRPYGLFLKHIRKLVGVQPEDPREVIREKIAALPVDADAELSDAGGRALEILLSVQQEAEVAPSEAEGLKREILALLHHSTREIASRGPLVLVYDDLHWADAASVEVIIDSLKLTEELPVLILCAMRPYRQAPGWRVKESAERDYPHRYTEVVLEPLGDSESDELVGNLLTVAELPDEVRSLIRGKAEGNPFFVEEVIRALIDAGAVTQDEDGLRWRATGRVEDIAIPDNLQALLVSRIDRLEKDIRRTLQLAAVIGRSFFYKVLEAIAEAAEGLNEHLNTLQRVELIREAARLPELEYVFRHELTRDAAYHSILRRERRVFHRRVGEAIETLFPEQADEEAHRLAHHFLEAGEHVRALNYFVKAGDAARQIYANDEAITHYRSAIEILSRVELPPEDLIPIYTHLGRTYEVTGRYDEALELYADLEARSLERADRTVEVAAVMAQATVLATPTAKWDTSRATELSKRALDLAQVLDDPAAEAKALWLLLLVSVFSNADPHEAIDFGERSLALAREHGLLEQEAYTLQDLGRAYSTAGDSQKSDAYLSQAVELWRQLGDKPMLADSLTTLASRHTYAGEVTTAISLAEEALEVSRSIASLWGQAYSQMALGTILVEKGEIGRGLQAMEDVLPLSRLAGFTAGIAYVPSVAATIYASLGYFQRAMELLDQAIDEAPGMVTDVEVDFLHGVRAILLAREGDFGPLNALQEQVGQDGLSSPSQEPALIVWSTILQAEVYSAVENYGDLLSLLEERLASLSEKRVIIYHPVLFLLKAKGHRAMGDYKMAREAISAGLQIAEQLGVAFRKMWLHVEMAHLEADAGSGSAPGDILLEARQAVMDIAESIDRPELRQSFLDLPAIRSVLKDRT